VSDAPPAHSHGALPFLDLLQARCFRASVGPSGCAVILETAFMIIKNCIAVEIVWFREYAEKAGFYGV
jgi:hypothetical protein